MLSTQQSRWAAGAGADYETAWAEFACPIVKMQNEGSSSTKRRVKALLY
ncbi:MAG TPA: hypothetical protein VG168_05560 [Bryobacteraceae bacterium]|jgi:hypothetical protein|nr:hypothetical protein [Bryobacteraceae bacterium]